MNMRIDYIMPAISVPRYIAFKAGMDSGAITPRLMPKVRLHTAASVGLIILSLIIRQGPPGLFDGQSCHVTS